jgi:3-oxoacyl-(acyl-carrier-protein) synthase
MDVRGDGYAPSSGAAALYIEELEHARNRGAKMYAEIRGYSSIVDGTAEIDTLNTQPIIENIQRVLD